MKVITRSARLPKFDVYTLSHHRWLLELAKDINVTNLMHIVVSTRVMSYIIKSESAKIRFASSEDFEAYTATLEAAKALCVFYDGKPRLSCSRVVQEDGVIFLLDDLSL